MGQQIKLVFSWSQGGSGVLPALYHQPLKSAPALSEINVQYMACSEKANRHSMRCEGRLCDIDQKHRISMVRSWKTKSADNNLITICGHLVLAFYDITQ